MNNIDVNKTVESWADIVIKMWKRKIIQLNIGKTGALFDSLQYEIISHAGGDPARIDFMYKYYGRFVDMGVGREMSVGNQGEVNTSRKPKKWYSAVMFSQVKRLSEILKQKYNIIGASVISENIIENEKKQSKPKRPGGDVANRHSMAASMPAITELSELDRVWMRRNGLLNS